MRTLDYPAMVAFDDGYEKGFGEGLRTGEANAKNEVMNEYHAGYDKGFVDGAKAALKDAGWNVEAIEEWLSERHQNNYNESDYRP